MGSRSRLRTRYPDAPLVIEDTRDHMIKTLVQFAERAFKKANGRPAIRDDLLRLSYFAAFSAIARELHKAGILINFTPSGLTWSKNDIGRPPESRRGSPGPDPGNAEVGLNPGPVPVPAQANT